jgi:predicted Zn-dependent peptidase
MNLLLTSVVLGAQLRAVPPVFHSELRALTYPNGMRAVVAKTPPVEGRAPRAFVGLYLRYGMATTRRPDLAHLVEHIGANNSPSVIDYQVPAQFATFGGNAMTRPDYMSFWRTVTPDVLEPIAASRANRAVGVMHDTAVFTTQVGRVAGEYERMIARISKDGLTATDLLPGVMRGSDVPLTALIDSIRSYDTATVYREIDQYFRPDNALLVIAGDVDMAATVAMLNRRLANLLARRGPAPRVGPALAAQSEPRITRDPHVQAIRVGLGFPAPPREGPAFLAALVVDQYLMGGRDQVGDTVTIARSLSTPFGERLVSTLGARDPGDGTYYRTDPPPLAQRSPSYFRATFEVSRPLSADSTITLVKRALNGALTTDFTDAAIARAKAELIAFMGNWLMAPDLLPLADHLAAFTFIDGDASRLARLPAEIAALTPAQVRKVATTYFGPRAARMVLVVPEP